MEDPRKNYAKFLLPIVVMLLAAPLPVSAQTIYQIWHPESEFASEPAGSICVFRKKLSLIDPEEAMVYVAASGQYEMFLNGRTVRTASRSLGNTIEHDVSELLSSGVNLISLKVTHAGASDPGVAVKFRVREKGEQRWRSLTSDDTWIVQKGAPDNWYRKYVDEQAWSKAHTIQSARFQDKQIVYETTEKTTPFELASTTKKITRSTEPANFGVVDTADSYEVGPVETESALPDAVASDANASTSESPVPIELKSPERKIENKRKSDQRFSVDSEFQVEQIMTDKETGSLIAMAFNEFGQLILSKEGGPLFVADVTKEPGNPERIKILCNDVNSCQGILPLNGNLFVTGKGPTGVGLYKLTDENRDGVFQVDSMLFKFQGDLSEHGPHAVRLGPDGMIYVIIGNSSKCLDVNSPTSPYGASYEGDLIPRVEDPGGHAVGVKAPGGTVIRTNLTGDFVETVCGGVRNAYDFVFDHNGEMFLHDSDLETNIGMAWYRPTRIYHVPNGAELGWRSGWSKFPNYFTDVTPPLVETGRGSPSGAVLYQHFQFPARFHNTLFFADWSEGRILSARPKPQGSSYTLEVEEFVTGKPMNVTDLDVGMDGTLFFCTGGRGTAGGVYRVAWQGDVPEELYNFSNRFEEVIRMPQPNAPWARQATALIRRELDQDWGQMLEGIVLDQRNDISYRLRALNLMFFHGPFPKHELISELKLDDDYRIRAKIAMLCGLKKDRTENVLVLEELISDQHPMVRRKAAESYLRIEKKPPVEKIIAMLDSQDRFEIGVARRLLERMPEAAFRDIVMESDQPSVFIHGSIALMTKYPKLETSYDVLARASNFMDGYLSDAQFSDVLRVSQIALFTGKVDPTKIAGFGDRIANEFPAGSGIINKQLARLMAYMKNANVDNRVETYFDTSDNNHTDKLFVAMQLHSIGESLSDPVRFKLIDFLENSMLEHQGSTYRSYINTAISDLASICDSPDQLQHILQNGGSWPHAMLQAFFAMKGPLSEQQVDWVIKADQEMTAEETPNVRRIRMGVIAMLAESNNQKAFEYLRQIWRERSNYRNEISLGLAQEPTGQNWAYLVTSIPILDDTIGREVALALAGVKRRPKNARQYRELIELGFRLRGNGGLEVSKLLAHWTSNQEGVAQAPDDSWSDAMQHWREWYGERWPNELPISVNEMPSVGQYSADQVLEHLDKFASQGQIGTGRYVFKKANCIACHKIRGEGASFGPDLTNLASRFSRREVLESIIHPSKFVSDQYRSKKLVTVDGQQLFGMLTRDSGGAFLLLDTDGKTTRVNEADIEDIADSDLSSMPDGLLDTLSLEEILHLFEYLYATESDASTAAADESNDFRR